MTRNLDDEAVPGTVIAERRAGPIAQGLLVTVLAGPGDATTEVVAQRAVIVGRSPGADVRLRDPMVSSFHVELQAVDGGVHMRDLQSRNGTLYAGARVERAVLPSGATLELGATLVRVEIDAPLRSPRADALTFGELRGQSAVMRELFTTLARLARTELAVLIEGATGTGKELVARGIHAACRPAGARFVVLDCAAIPGALADSVLFGHERGAFAGADDARAGVFEAADGGTVFLDEVGELPAELQPKLLRVLERREVVRVGSTRPRAVEVRVLGATSRDLRTMINQSRFREDLYYRLAQARVLLPALRERAEDVPVLVEHFLRALPASAPGARAIAPDALDALARRDYPGNVRELKSAVERAAMTAAGAVITCADLAFERMLTGERERAAAAPVASPSVPPPPDGPLEPFKEAKRTLIDEFERDYLQRILARTGGNLSRAASIAGIERHYLRVLFRKHGLRSDAP